MIKSGKKIQPHKDNRFDKVQTLKKDKNRALERIKEKEDYRSIYEEDE